jgi:hypothetical protein
MKKLFLVTALAALCAAPVAAAPPSLTLKASPTVVTYGGTTTLSGVLSTQKAGQSIDIQAQECGQNAFKRIASVTTTAGGAFSYAAKPTLNTNYQAKQKGATSPAVAVKVVPQLRLAKRSSSGTLRRFRVTLTSAQSFVGKYVMFQKRTSTSWKTVKNITLKSVKTTTAPTQVTSQNFTLRIKRHPKVRVLLPATQAGTCYQPATSNAVRS